MASPKILLPTLAAGTSAASVGGYMYATSGNKEVTILDKIKDSLKTHHRILTSKGDSAWDKFKKVYKEGGDKKISGVSEEQINGWCESTLEESFNKEKYDQAMMWCVIYDRSIKESLSKPVLSAEKTDEKWKKAWDKFNTGNSTAGELKLEDTALNNPTPNDRDKGGSALNEWCTSKYEMKMYELGAEALSKKVEKWCNEDAGK
ncbi:hypothetical protein HF1_13130 [Mycoplasma haemofelis str. Langford 1]|uniref:Uncharacterized protein n=1 Tax=Mycoplasma haemofelis (strain Langford 1) TaxID=941640 RepID=E8ZJK0_MYCHL|nr:hypothetical protein [Mycoplasma haemofelis]CBY93321.1 hypothetical protein HF1_13130 [Mycoplasma haemofelis str. Langford 1]